MSDKRCKKVSKGLKYRKIMKRVRDNLREKVLVTIRERRWIKKEKFVEEILSQNFDEEDEKKLEW